MPLRLTKILLVVLALAGLLCMVRVNFNLGSGLLLTALTLAAYILPWKLDPLTERKLKRFREIKRGYYSFGILITLAILSLFAELFANGRALVVKYDGSYHFPIYSSTQLGHSFGLTGRDANAPVNYRNLQEYYREQGDGNWVLMPIIPYSPNENITYDGILRPQAPSWERQHYLGTDSTSRDILSRLIYGFRIAIYFSVAFMLMVYLIGIAVGCLMGYFGGWFDLVVQRMIEIWSLVPFIYIVIIIFSIVPTGFSVGTRIGILLLIMVLFSWTGMTYYMRTATYKEKARDYTAAAQVIGASTARIIFHHILPNAVSTLVTFMPFTLAAAITSITALDFLGFGLPPPTPSIGEILKQGTARLDGAPWIVTSAFFALVFMLTLVTFIGEAVREAFDPRKFTFYR